MTFYDDEEIEENENPEEGQSEENELAEGEQEENDAGSYGVGAEDQYDGIDDLSSRGTMGGNRQRHGNRQRQIEKARNMMNKGKNVAQRGQQAGKKMASGAKGQASKKAAEEGAKKTATAATKVGAKAGASAAGAGTGAAAGGAGAAMGPCFGGCLVLAIIIFLLIGIVGFFQNMPDMILGKIYEWFNTKLDSWRIAFGEDPGSPGMVSNDDIVDTANYILDMGYDLKGYGFLAEVESDEDRENNITKQETYYTFLFYNPADWGIFQSNFMIQYDGNQVWTAGPLTNPNNYQTKEIGLGENIDEQIKIIYAGATDGSGGNWIDHNAEITVRVTRKGDEVEYTKVLQRKISEATIDESSRLITYEVGEAEYVNSDFIRAYLASDNRTYMFNDGKTLNWFQQLFHGLFSEDRFTKSVNGLINIDPEMVESLESDSQDSNTEEYDGEIHLVREEKKLYIPPGKEVGQYEPDYIYDLNGWAGKYGKPLEFLLTLHLATLAPDFTYAVALGDERLDTKVNIKFYQTNYSRRLLLNGEDALTVVKENFIETIESKTFDDLYHSLENRYSAFNYSVEREGNSIVVYHILFQKNEYLRYTTEDLENMKTQAIDLISAYNGGGYTDLSNALRNLGQYFSDIEDSRVEFINKMINIINYNNDHANLSMYIPYISSVDDHWYRDLDFKDPEVTQGYIVKIDEGGAAPYVENVDDLKKILATYSDAQGARNLVGAADAFMQIQNEYGINAIFAASVAIKESGAGTAWDLIDSSTYNWMSTQGSRGGGYKDRNGTTWNRFSSFSEATLAFGELISGESTGNYFGKGYYSVGDIAAKGGYCDPPGGWIKGVCSQMEAFYNRAVNELGITLVNGENIDSGLDDEQDTANSGDESAYEVVAGPSGEVALVDGELNGYTYLNPSEGYTVLRTQAEDLRQVREPVQYDNSAVIKELLGVVDTRVIKKYTDGETVNVEDEDQLAIFEAKVAEKAKYYIYNGTGINEGEKRQISPTRNSLTAISILESTKTEDAEHLLKNLRELFNDIGFELEDSSEEQATKYDKVTSLQWIFKSYVPSYDWPSPEETPKTEDDEESSRYIYKVSAQKGGNDEDTQDTETDDIIDLDNGTNEDGNNLGNVGFKGGDVLVAPGNCVIKKIGEDYLTIQFRNVIKHEIYTKREWNGSEYVITEISTKEMSEEELEEYKAQKREELGLDDSIDPLWDPEVNGTTLTVFGLEVDSNLKVDETTIIEAGTEIGKTKEGVDIGLLLRGQDLTASDADNEDATENIPSEEDEDGEEKLAFLSVPRYIYPPEKEEVVGDYIVKTDEYGAAPKVNFDSTNEEDFENAAIGLSKILETYGGINNEGRTGKYRLHTLEFCRALLEAQSQYNVNAIYLATSSIFTCGGGRSLRVGYESYHNYLNINKGDGTPVRYTSPEDCFVSGGKLLAEKYFSEGRITVTQIRQKWNPGAENRDPPRSQEMISQMTAFFLRAHNFTLTLSDAQISDLGLEEFKYWQPPDNLYSGDILGIAKQLHDYVRDNNFTYDSHHNIKDLGSGTERKVIDCSAYVSWVLYELGYQEFGTQKRSAWFKSNGQKLCDKYGWQMITPVNSSTLQPGDILVVYGKYINGKLQHHVEIYAGNGRSYSCGSDDSIRADTVKTNFSRYDFALRVTGRGGN